jgi:acyl-CoA hydrolase
MTDLMEAKTVADSRVELTQQMVPSDANAYGHVHGGALMRLVDATAGAVAARHSRHRVATVQVESMSFLAPVQIGDILTVRASVNDVGRTSMEIGVRVDAENVLTGTSVHISTAYLIMVALDENGRPVPVPGLVAETADEKRRLTDARKRRAAGAANRR